MAESDGRSEAVLAVTSFVTALSFIFVTARSMSRAFIIKSIDIDDWLMISAWLVAFGMSFSVCYSTRYGLGLFGTQIIATWEPQLRRLIYSSNVLYNPALMLSKTSILLQYSKLFSSNQVFRWFNIATIVVVNLGGFALTLMNAFQCSPPDAVFNTLQSTELNNHCTSVLTIYLSSAPLNIITDVAILLLPMPIVKQLNLPWKQKIVLTLTFGFGVFVTIIDVVRVAYLQSAASEELSNAIDGAHHTQNTDTNFYRDAALSFMWSAVEVHVGIICANVPSLKPLVSKLVPHFTRLSSVAESSTLARPSEHGSPSDRTYHNTVELQSSDVYDTHEQPSRGTGHLASGLHQSSYCSVTGPRDQQLHRSSIWAQRESPKSLVHLSGRETFRPFLIFTSLFFVWGVEYGWLDILNRQFQTAANMTAAQNSALHSAYYSGYFCGPLCVGYFSLKYWGFKATCVTGLGIYACGTLIFWPAAVLTSFSACFITNFIVGFGLSNVEVAANPFIILCGSPALSASRLCLSQGFQAIGSVVAALVANSTFARPHTGTSSLIGSQWVYLGMSLFTIFLAILFFLISLPEATAQDLRLPESSSSRRTLGVSTATIILALGVMGQFCYVGAQEVNETSLDAYLAVVAPSFNLNESSTVVHVAFATSRFLGAGLALFIPPPFLLLGFCIGATVFEGLAMDTHFSGGTNAIMLGFVFFMEGPIFPLIFAIALRPMGEHTKHAAVALTSSISGGAIFSPIALAIQQSHPRGTTYSLFVAVATFAAATTFPILLNVVPPLQDMSRIAMERQKSDSGTLSRSPIELSNLGHNNKSADHIVVNREMTVEFVQEITSTRGS